MNWNRRMQYYQLMNKIKIINTQVLKQLRNSKNELRISLKQKSKKHKTVQQYLHAPSSTCQLNSFNRRPMTPSDVIRDLYQKQSSKTTIHGFVHSDLRPQRKQRIKTAQTYFPISFQQRQRVQIKKNRSYNPRQSHQYSCPPKYSKQEQSEQKIVQPNRHVSNTNKKNDEPLKIKNEIELVLRYITTENQLAKKRMDKKMSDYKQNKFDRFWRAHNLKKISCRLKQTCQHSKHVVRGKNGGNNMTVIVVSNEQVETVQKQAYKLGRQLNSEQSLRIKRKQTLEKVEQTEHGESVVHYKQSRVRFPNNIE